MAAGRGESPGLRGLTTTRQAPTLSASPTAPPGDRDPTGAASGTSPSVASVRCGGYAIDIQENGRGVGAVGVDVVDPSTSGP
jgi:hypothetical protein